MEISRLSRSFKQWYICHIMNNHLAVLPSGMMNRNEQCLFIFSTWSAASPAHFHTIQYVSVAQSDGPMRFGGLDFIPWWQGGGHNHIKMRSIWASGVWRLGPAAKLFSLQNRMSWTDVCLIGAGGRFKNAYELLNLSALKISTLYKNCIFQCMGKTFCVEFQRYPLKFHTKYLTHTLKDMQFICR